MIFLLLSIACSTFIFILFKSFTRYRIQTFQAIVANYLVAFAFGWSMTEGDPTLATIPQKEWFSWAIGLGTLFITLFYLMAFSAQNVSIAVTSVASKMALVIPVIIFVVIDSEETLGVPKIAGLVLAITGIFLSTPPDRKHGFDWKMVLLPVIIFLGSGLIDFILGYTQDTFLSTRQDEQLFATIPFLWAFFLGILLLVFRLITKRAHFSPRSWLAGLVLGIVNYGSIYFLIRTFGSELMQKSSVIPVNNMSIVVLSAVMAAIIFGEKPSRRNIIGLVVSLASIAIIGWWV
ncbi:EamA family transporter [Halocola ammonii]